MPISLKELTTNRLGHIIRVINNNIQQIVKNRNIIGKPELYIKLQKISYKEIKDFAENGPLIKIPNEGLIKRIIFFTPDGKYIIK